MWSSAAVRFSAAFIRGSSRKVKVSILALAEGRAIVFALFTSQTASKRRAAVIVSSGEYGTERADIVVMAITSQLRAALSFGEVWLRSRRDAGLLKTSAVKPVIATLEQSLVIRVLGRLPTEDQTAVRASIEQIFGRPS